MGLRELSQAYQQENLPRRAVVVTFDDGYYDNLANAKPLLERYSIPATLFVATGYSEREGEFWSDELERLLLQPGNLPDTLNLTITGKRHHWNLGDATSYSEEEYRAIPHMECSKKEFRASPGFLQCAPSAYTILSSRRATGGAGRVVCVGWY